MNKETLKHLKFLVLFSGLLFGGGPAGFFAGSLAYAGAPMRMNFQGRLEENGEAVEGAKSFIFRLYDALSGGNLVWTSQAQNVIVSNGVFSVVLGTGSVNGIPVNLSTATFGGVSYVEVEVNGATLLPRQEIVSAPYALVAQALSSDAKVSLSSLEAGALGADVIVSSIAADAVYDASIRNGAVTFLKIAPNGCATGEIMKRNAGNTAWECALDDGAGSGISLAPPSPNVTNSPNDSIYINNTGGGNLLRLQTAGADKFVISNSGMAVLAGGITAASATVTGAGGLLVAYGVSAATAVITNTGAGALAVAGGIKAGTGNVGIVDATGRIPALNATYLANLDGSNLTGITGTAKKVVVGANNGTLGAGIPFYAFTAGTDITISELTATVYVSGSAGSSTFRCGSATDFIEVVVSGTDSIGTRITTTALKSIAKNTEVSCLIQSSTQDDTPTVALSLQYSPL